MNGARESKEVLILAFLGGLVVIRVGGKDAIYATDLLEARGHPEQNAGGVVGAPSPDRDASRGGVNDDVDGVEPLVFLERRRFAGGTAGHQKIDAGVDLPIHQSAQSLLIDRKVRVRPERRHECRATSSCFHHRRVY